ncbi:MAG: hypothetical protein EA376_09540 [Phycisphaeraceae bacterium]|nr:MAG: hypothetical protein EA376_09540 [Phycisphaeraceae bacterium]
MSRNACIISLLRHHNDIDHIAPILWALSKSGGAEICAVVSSRRSLLRDPRLVFLGAQPGVSISFIEDHLTDAEIRKARGACGEEGHIVLGMDDETVHRCFDRLVSGATSSLVALDWIMNDMPEIGFAERVAAWGNLRSIPVVSLPHGDAPYINRMFRPDAVADSQADNFSRSAVFDAVFVPNRVCAARYLPHMPAERVRIVGSPRYNSEWLETLDGIDRDHVSWNAGADLRIAFFLRHFRWPIHWEEAERTIEMIRSIEGAAVMIQHHPRSVGEDEFRRRHPGLFQDGPGVRIDRDGISSRVVTRWANVALDIGTSAVFDAVQLGTRILSIEYLHPSRSVVSHFIPGAEVRCRDELHDALRLYRNDSHARLSSPADERRFIDEMIHTPDEHVLPRCVAALLEILEDSAARSAPTVAGSAAL